MNMNRILLPLAVLMLLSTNAVAKQYLGSYLGLNGALTGNGPVESVGMVTLSEGASGASAGINVSAEYTGQVFSVNEAGPTNPHPAMMFGGQNNTSAKSLGVIAQLAPMSSVGQPLSAFYSPTLEDIGTGLDPDTTYAFSQFVSVEELLNLTQVTNDSYLMGQVTYTFSQPVDNPILHVTGLGGFFSSSETGLSMLFSVDLELAPGPYSLTKLSGSAFTELDVGNRIKNVYNYDDYANNEPAGAKGALGETAGSGSFEVNGAAITSVTFNVYMVGKMTAPAPSSGDVPSYWTSLDNNINLDGVPQTESLAVQKYAGDRFNTTWTLPLDKDFGDAIDDGTVINSVARNYATDNSNNGPYHRVVSGLRLGSIVDAETDVVPGSAGLKDDQTGGADEDGVTFNAFGDGSSVTAMVTGTNDQGQNAMLCGWLDGAADSVRTGEFNRSVSYTANEVGQTNPVVTAGNEELCIMVPELDTQSTAVSLAGGSNPAEASCTGGVNFSCTLTWNPNFTDHVHTFARFRLTSAQAFFDNSSPSPMGYVLDGEVEDYALDITPSAVKPDLTPVITLLPNVMVGPTDFEVFVQIIELLDADTSGSITVRVPKDGRWSVTSWDPGATVLTVSGKPLNNAVWTFSEDANALIFTTTTTILGATQSNLGFSAAWNAGQTLGSFTGSVVIVSGSGTEIRTDNNTDAEQADYSFQ